MAGAFGICERGRLHVPFFFFALTTVDDVAVVMRLLDGGSLLACH